MDPPSPTFMVYYYYYYYYYLGSISLVGGSRDVETKIIGAKFEGSMEKYLKVRTLAQSLGNLNCKDLIWVPSLKDKWT